MRTAAVLLTGVLAAGCAAHAPAPEVYDFDAIEPAPAPATQLNASITVPPVSAPTWLATTAVSYRLGFSPPYVPRAYAHSRWVAPPAELLTARLRQLLAVANAGFTLTRGAVAAGGYRLDVTLEQLEQVYSAPDVSRSLVSLRATLSSARDGHVLAQRSFQAGRPAPSPNAAGGVRALVQGSDECLAEMLRWLEATVPATATP